MWNYGDETLRLFAFLGIAVVLVVLGLFLYAGWQLSAHGKTPTICAGPKLISAPPSSEVFLSNLLGSMIQLAEVQGHRLDALEKRVSVLETPDDSDLDPDQPTASEKI